MNLKVWTIVLISTLPLYLMFNKFSQPYENILKVEWIYIGLYITQWYDVKKTLEYFKKYYGKTVWELLEKKGWYRWIKIQLSKLKF